MSNLVEFMSNPIIQLSVQSDSSQSVGELISPVSRATIEFFDQYQPSYSGQQISLNPSDGFSAKDFALSQSLGFGELRCISQACVSDVSVFESDNTLANVEPGLLANAGTAGIMENMSESITFEALNSELLGTVPRLHSALDGQLDYNQLSQLIADVQAQVLELNSLSHNLFGDLAGEVQEATVAMSELDADSLITAMQIDSGLFAQPGLAGSNEHSLALEATLDGLFTSPEAFPLTLDFSNPGSVQEASELFAATGGTSSISSIASNTETDAGFGSSASGNPDNT